MDILQKYNEENQETPQQTSQWESSDEYGMITRLVIRFFGGRIENEQQANFVLVIVAVIIFVISFFILTNPFGNTRPVPPGIINLPGQPPRLGPTIAPEL